MCRARRPPSKRRSRPRCDLALLLSGQHGPWGSFALAAAPGTVRFTSQHVGGVCEATSAAGRQAERPPRPPRGRGLMRNMCVDTGDGSWGKHRRSPPGGPRGGQRALETGLSGGSFGVRRLRVGSPSSR